MFYSTKYDSPVGIYTLACDGENLVAVWRDGQKYYGGSLSGPLTYKDDLPVFRESKNWLDRYFAGENPKIQELKLAPIGNSFRQVVWSALCEIPYGKTVTYGDIAKSVEAKTNKTIACQAIGGAVGHNPISVIIPCHRVVGKRGSLTGYAGGIDTKIKLLELEKADTAKLFIPKKSTAL